MILNTFKREVVLRVLDTVMSKDPEIIFAENLSDYSIEEAQKVDYLKLNYEPMFHRLELRKLDLDEPLYANPRCTVTLLPEELFIEKCIPNETYHKIMSS